MKMIRHHHKPAGKPTITRWAVQHERNETLKCGFIVEDAGATRHAGCEEIRNIPVAVGPDTMQAAQSAWGWFVGNGIVGRVP
jgi:hypothetical protein